ncbi:CHAT domain-containing protein, partial [Nostoc sp.]
MKKILIVSANPTTTDKLRLDEEVREIQEGLQRSRSREKFELITKWAVRADDLRRALLDHDPHIIHFSGHGGGNQGLALENNTGQMQLVSTESLARLFKLFKDKVECILLNPTFRTSKCNTLMFQRILLIAANYLSINTEI